jgi:hypothetical protein
MVASVSRMLLRCFCCCLIAGVGTTIGSAQQSGRTDLSILAGPSPYDLSGTGTGFAAKATVTLRPGPRVLQIEPALSYFSYEPQLAGSRQHWILPELGVYLGAFGGSVRPYGGIGLGSGWSTGAGSSRQEFTLHAAAGLRIAMTENWSLRGELRLRSVDPWAGNMADFGFGVSRRID